MLERSRAFGSGVVLLAPCFGGHSVRSGVTRAKNALAGRHGDQSTDPAGRARGDPDAGADDVAHEASLEELGRLVKTLGYEVVGTVSQKREGTGAGSLLGSGKLAELAALTGGTGVVGSMAPPPKSKARARFEGAAEDADTAEADVGGGAQARVRHRRPRAVAEPDPQPRARHRRAGAGPHRRHRRDLPSPRQYARGAAAGRDGAAEIRGAAAARIARRRRAAAGAGRGRKRARARSPQDPRPAFRAEGAARGGAARRRPAARRPGATSCAWRWSATPTPASRR